MHVVIVPHLILSSTPHKRHSILSLTYTSHPTVTSHRIFSHPKSPSLSQTKMHRTRRDGRERRGGPISLAVRGIASGVGLVSESIKAHKESKREEELKRSTSDSGRDEGSSRIPAAVGNGEAPPAYDAPDYAPGSRGRDGYRDEKTERGSEREGLPQYQDGDGTRSGQYPDEKAENASRDDVSVGSHNPYRDAMSASGPSQSQQSLSPSQYPDEKSRSRAPSPNQQEQFENDLEDQWALDDAQEDLSCPRPSHLLFRRHVHNHHIKHILIQ